MAQYKNAMLKAQKQVPHKLWKEYNNEKIKPIYKDRKYRQWENQNQ